ncbi:MAG: hypothetical protein KGL48_00280 [Sphingomonadales bacterium]|nr:hypothetical protein [Sphingomonadales bacterium]MDE2569553.1 hypothetical protein [Sphingomonadales bacterium]
MKLLAPIIVAAGLVSLAGPVQAIAPGSVTEAGHYTLDIVGYVPVICRTSVASNIVAPDGNTVQLGTLENFCNSPTGYQVIADYSASLAGATMFVDGNAVTLQSDGSTVVTKSDHASIENHSLALDLPAGEAASGSISFRIEPI